MAFAKDDLRRIGSFPAIVDGGPNPGLFLHRTADTAANVTGAGYFNAAAALLPVGSVIISVTSTGGTPAVATKIVTANTGTAVTIA